MALPNPGYFSIGEMPDQRQRLWIVHDDNVAFFEMKPGSILEYYFLVNRLVLVGKFDLVALQRVVKLFCAGEEVGSTLDEMPLGFDTDRIHHQRQWRENFGDAAAVKRRTYMRHPHGTDTIRLPHDPLDGFGADDRLVVLKRVQAER